MTVVVMVVAVTAIWGWTFLIVKDAIHSYPVTSFLALRFTLAAGLLLPLVTRQFSWRQISLGALIGIPLAAGYLFQTWGLKTASAADAGVLTGLFAIFTPVLDRFMYGTAIASVTWIAVAVGLLGTGLLTLTNPAGPSIGDLLEVMTAVAFALQVVWLGRFAPGNSANQLTFGQIAFAALAFLALSAASGSSHFSMPKPSVWVAIFITGALATTLGFWVQTFAQQELPPARVAIVLLGEPGFAAGFAVWLGGERLSLVQWFGASLILISLVFHEAWVALHPKSPLHSSQGLRSRRANPTGE